MFRTVPLLTIRSFSLHTHSNGICHTHLLTVRKLSANLYDIYHCCVYSENPPDDGERDCPKYVVCFIPKINLRNYF